MGNKLYNEQSVQDIADAIRSVNGSTDTYTISEMSAAVAGISTGLDWAQLNYNTSGPNKGTPAEVVNGFQYGIDIKEGKNLFNKNDSNLILSGYVDENSYVTYPDCRTICIPIDPNTTYTVSKIITTNFRIATSSVYPTNESPVNKFLHNDSATSLTLTTGSTDSYLLAYIYYSGGDTLTLDQILATVQIEQNAHATAYAPYCRYTNTSTYVQDKNLLFWPNIDITGRYNYQQLFDRSSLLHCPALTLGEEVPTGSISTNYMFKETLIESATINSVNDASVAYNSTFIDCKRLKSAQINTPASATEHMFEGCASLTTVNLFDTSAVTNARYMFKGCSSLVTAPLYDLSACTLLNELFNGCTALVNIPLYDASACTNFTSFVNNCLNLSDTSLDNILQMCIDATAYTGTKKLSQLGVNSAYDTRIATLPHYQDFLNAGWIIR